MKDSPQTTDSFQFTRRVAYYDTDAMGVVHHSNYVRYFEDARVAWMRESGLIHHHLPQGKFVFAVHEMGLNFKKPLRFDDEFTVELTKRIDGIRLRFAYVITRANSETGAKDVIADGHTVIIPIDSQFQPARLPAAARALF